MSKFHKQVCTMVILIFINVYILYKYKIIVFLIVIKMNILLRLCLSLVYVFAGVYASNVAAASPEVRRFEWSPAVIAVGQYTTFYWDIRNVQRCYSTTSGPELVERAINGSVGPVYGNVPAAITSKWYCIDLSGNRYPSNPTQYLQATRTIVAAMHTVSVTTGQGGTASVGTHTVIGGDTTTINFSAAHGYNLKSVTGCDGLLSGNRYTTAPINSACSIRAEFYPLPVVAKFQWIPDTVEVGKPTYFHWDVKNVQKCITTSGEPNDSDRAGAGVIGPVIINTASTNVSRWYCIDLAGQRFPSASNSFLEATRTFVPLTVTANSGSGGNISPTSRSVNYAVSTTFTVTPNSGFQIASVSGCNGSLSGNTYTTETLTTGCSVSASFTAQITVTYKHTDMLGSVIAESNAQGDITSRSQYEPFGKRLGGEAAGIGYTGHLQDEDLDLTYMQARYYDPIIGRFYSNDPVGFTASNPMMFNRYAYANNNPYAFNDPDGRNPRRAVMQMLKDPVRTVRSASRSIKGVLQQAGVIPPPAPMRNEGVPDELADIPIGSDGEAGSSESGSGSRGGLLPKPPTGPGSVPKSERDPKRFFSPDAREAKRNEQGGKCADGCGSDIDSSNSAGHHIDRHADGGKTVPENHAEVCTDCHKELHSKD
ncbi:HNH endonuclease [Rheinheimera muenzenbergensis]|uniref:HNH endonuclease n=1 Tax=Rheinheimera muenzenbergensis TaxID=1193628 RepID=A0ABU8CB30_9GAMM